MVKLKPGSRYGSVVCATEVVVVVAPDGDVCLECGGQPMAPLGPGAPARSVGQADVAPAWAAGTQLGKRYVAAAGAKLEVLCTKAGEGSLAVDGQPLTIKESKKLPSSD